MYVCIVYKVFSLFYSWDFHRSDFMYVHSSGKIKVG
jgi:hypothetical protein